MYTNQKKATILWDRILTLRERAVDLDYLQRLTDLPREELDEIRMQRQTVQDQLKKCWTDSKRIADFTAMCPW